MPRRKRIGGSRKPKKCKPGTVFVPIKHGRRAPGVCMTPDEYVESGEDVNKYSLLPDTVNALKAAVEVTETIDKAIVKAGKTFNEELSKAKKKGRRFRLGIDDTATREEIFIEFKDKVVEEVDL